MTIDLGNKIKELRIQKKLTQEDLALLSGFSKSYIQKFEENKREIKSSHLVQLSNALEVSIFDFLESTNYIDHDFTFKNIEFREKNNIYDVEAFKRQITADLYPKFSAYETLEKLLEEKIKFRNPLDDVNISNINDVENTVSLLRKKWKFGATPIYDLISFLEDLGIKIFEVDKEDNFVGFSCWMKKTPVIVINTRNKDIPRRRFTILHELSHLLLKFKEDVNSNNIESLCDQFAGAMLLPKEILNNYLSLNSISIEELKRIKIKYGVSVNAILVRMVSIGFINWNKYHEWKEIYYSKKDKNDNYGGIESVSRFDYLLAKAIREDKMTYQKACELTGKSISELKDNYLFKC